MSKSGRGPGATAPSAAGVLPPGAWAIAIALIAAAVLWELVPYRLTARFPLETLSGPHPAVFHAEFGYITHTGVGLHFALGRRSFYGRLELEPTRDGPESTYEIFEPDLEFRDIVREVEAAIGKSFSDSVVSRFSGELSLEKRRWAHISRNGASATAGTVGRPKLGLVFYGRLPSGDEQPIGRVDGRLSRLAIGR